MFIPRTNRSLMLKAFPWYDSIMKCIHYHMISPSVGYLMAIPGHLFAESFVDWIYLWLALRGNYIISDGSRIYFHFIGFDRIRIRELRCSQKWSADKCRGASHPYTHTHTRTNSHARANAHAHTHTNARTLMHARIRTYTHTHMHSLYIRRKFDSVLPVLVYTNQPILIILL